MVRKQKPDKDIKFVVAEGTDDLTISRQMLQHPVEHPNSKSKAIYRPWVCHYCGRNGHIRSYCFKLYVYPNHFQQRIHEPKVVNVEKSGNPNWIMLG